MTARTRTATKTRTAQAAAQATDATIKSETQNVDALHDAVEREAAKSNWFATFNIYLMSLGQAPAEPPIPTTRRLIVAFIASIATFAVGAVSAIYLATWLANLAFAVTAWGFISIVIYMMVYIIGVLAATYAAGMVAKYIATGAVVNDMNRVAGWVGNKLSGASSYVKGSLAAKRAEATL